MTKDNKDFNPFYIFGSIPDKYFCDRGKESDWLTTAVANGDNVVLISPRRMGKTSLIVHNFEKPRIRDNYHTFFIDILSTSNLSEFVYLFSRSIYETLMPRGQKAIYKFMSFLKSLRGTMGIDAITGMPTFSITSTIIPDPAMTLGEIFTYLKEADKRCLVTIDEFQQISKYPEKNVEALLRTYIQHSSNCNFIYSGSERHMMMQMFHDSSRPFYNSATVIDLRPIPKTVYVDFAIDNFKDADKRISPETVDGVYDQMQGNTFYMQRVMNSAFAMTPIGEECTKETVDRALVRLLDINESYYREQLSLISAKHKPLLYAIAKTGECTSIQSSNFIMRNNLGTASQVQNAARQLVDNGIVNLSEGVYSLSDKFLALWIRKTLL